MIARLKSSFSYFGNHFTAGIKYALYFMAVSAVMGFIYGAFGGIWIAPAFVAISYVGIFVTLNFVFALILGVINLFPALFKKGSKRLSRYFSFSLAFLLVFLTYFVILKYSGFEPF
jgi:hypothetical protein